MRKKEIFIFYNYLLHITGYLLSQNIKMSDFGVNKKKKRRKGQYSFRKRTDIGKKSIRRYQNRKRVVYKAIQKKKKKLERVIGKSKKEG